MSLSDIEKAAILLVALGPERSQRILDQLGADELLPIIAAMKKTRQIDEATRKAALADIANWLDPENPGHLPTSDAATNLLSAMGPYLPESTGNESIDWTRAGFDFGSDQTPPPRLPGTHRPDRGDSQNPEGRR